MRPSRYILDEQYRPVPCGDLMEWAAWFESADRCVAFDDIDNVHISTVFIGMDHRFPMSEEEENYLPILFETCIFNYNKMEYVALFDREFAESEVGERYCTWEEAETGHRKAVIRVKGFLERQKQESETKSETDSPVNGEDLV